MREVTIGSLFSGIGGLDLGLERAGLGPVAWQVERDAWCRKILGWHWPHARSFVDVRKVGRSNLSPVDLVCGGFPCQDLSSAGRGAGLAGAKSGLWGEFRRIVEEIEPPIVVVENVASGARRWLPFVRRDLHLLGFRTRALAISAFDVGAPHKRERVFVLATHADRILLREQSGRSLGARGGGPGESRDASAQGPSTDADRVPALEDRGRADAGGRGPQGPSTHADGQGTVGETWDERYQWRWARDGDGWTIEPVLRGVAAGVPDVVRWLRALGNSVNVACAEVIGRVVVDEIRGAA